MAFLITIIIYHISTHKLSFLLILVFQIWSRFTGNNQLQPLFLGQKRNAQNFSVLLHMPIPFLPHQSIDQSWRRNRPHKLKVLCPVVPAVEFVSRQRDVDQRTVHHRTAGDYVYLQVLGCLQKGAAALVFLGKSLWHHYVNLSIRENCTGVWMNLKPWFLPPIFSAILSIS